MLFTLLLVFFMMMLLFMLFFVLPRHASQVVESLSSLAEGGPALLSLARPYNCPREVWHHVHIQEFSFQLFLSRCRDCWSSAGRPRPRLVPPLVRSSSSSKERFPQKIISNEKTWQMLTQYDNKWHNLSSSSESWLPTPRSQLVPLPACISFSKYTQYNLLW